MPRLISRAGKSLDPPLKRSVLPDFYIGANAAVMQWPLLTRDVTRYRTYFPTMLETRMTAAREICVKNAAVGANARPAVR